MTGEKFGHVGADVIDAEGVEEPGKGRFPASLNGVEKVLGRFGSEPGEVLEVIDLQPVEVWDGGNDPVVYEPGDDPVSESLDIHCIPGSRSALWKL